MDALFTPWRMGTLELPNRIVRSATWEGMALEDGTVTERLIELTADLARGGVGLIITGYAYVAPEGLAIPRQIGVYDDHLIDGLGRMADAVHAAGGKVALQIVHCGGQTRSKWIGGPPLGPSQLVHFLWKEESAELSRGQISEIVRSFAAAARRAKAAGFDAVQLHAAHGYLISQFLSPETNRREDEYGGPIENRARFCYEVYEAVRDQVGPDFPVFVKINSEDAVAGGLELADAVAVAKGLSDRGIDAIEVSGGVAAAGKNSPSRVVVRPEHEGYFLANARAIKRVVECPVIAVGGFRSRAVMAEALESVDAVAICRPLIRQPDFVNLLADGVTDKADCVSCNLCLTVAFKQGLGCGTLLGFEESR
jgi:2,4-dienoyl-CoA reductase-like NADH-dependent reductase (Old Yellow Enzyme family)